MSRRTILRAIPAVPALLAAQWLVAQPASGHRRLAYLSVGSPASSGQLIAQLIAGLRALGWIEGSNLVLDLRYAHGDVGRYAPLAAELLALRPDAFVTPLDASAVVVAAATKTVPIVFVLGADPVGRGLVKSLAKPGGNATGFATLDRELLPKRLQLLKQAVPGLTRVGVFTGTFSRTRLVELQDASRDLGLVLVPAVVDGPDDVDAAFETFSEGGAAAVLDDAVGTTIFVVRQKVAELAIKHRLPMLGPPATADSGVLLSYGADVSELFRRAATLVDRIFKGTKPADIPVEQINVYELVVNLRTARALGIELPRSLMLQATRLIE